MRIVLAGQGAMGSALFDAVMASPHALVGLLTQRRRWLGVGAPLQRRARHAGLPILDLGDAGALPALHPDLLLCGDFGAILGPEWLSVPTVGGLNAHWSLLPRHRGPIPGAAAILAGDSQTGLTFHALTARIDTGAIVDQTVFPLTPRDTAAAIYHRAARIAGDRIVGVLAEIDSHGLRGPTPEPSRGSYTRRLTTAQTHIDWTQTAPQIDRLVRACTRPMAHFRHRGQTVFLSACTPVEGRAPPGTVQRLSPIVVAAGEGALRIDRALTCLPPFSWPGWPAPRVGSRLISD
jgi:methionyl-tRNA formyltransferase